jgi:hypothetical protein
MQLASFNLEWKWTLGMVELGNARIIKFEVFKIVSFFFIWLPFIGYMDSFARGVKFWTSGTNVGFNGVYRWTNSTGKVIPNGNNDLAMWGYRNPENIQTQQCLAIKDGDRMLVSAKCTDLYGFVCEPTPGTTFEKK